MLIKRNVSIRSKSIPAKKLASAHIKRKKERKGSVLLTWVGHLNVSLLKTEPK